MESSCCVIVLPSLRAPPRARTVLILSCMFQLVRYHMFDALGLRAGVVVAVAFQQVDDAPCAEASAEGDHEGLKNGDCGVEECHIHIFLSLLEIG